MINKSPVWAFIVLLPAAAAAAAGSATPHPEEPVAADSPADRITAGVEPASWRDLVREALERSPEIAARRARARAAAREAPQVRALPDPMAALTLFPAPPETRVGPQRLSAMVSQRFPWFGTLGLRERAVLWGAAALEAEVEAARLSLVTEVRRLLHELDYLESEHRISEGFRGHLVQHEEVARVRYATGVGLGQGVIKIQAEITRVDNLLLGIESRRAAVVARLNALRDQEPGHSLPAEEGAGAWEREIAPRDLQRRALAGRPEIGAAEARERMAEARIELARKAYRPDLTLGFTYTVVEPRSDPAGRLMPPPDNGDDIFGIQGGIALPIRRGRLAAGVAEAEESRLAAERARRALEASVRGEVDDFASRLPLAWRQLHLLEEVLEVQAAEALDSARAGYVAGTLNALDLLDAEHVLYSARLASARARTDYLVALARLEGAIAGPIEGDMP